MINKLKTILAASKYIFAFVIILFVCMYILEIKSISDISNMSTKMQYLYFTIVAVGAIICVFAIFRAIFSKNASNATLSEIITKEANHADQLYIQDIAQLRYHNKVYTTSQTDKDASSIVRYCNDKSLISRTIAHYALEASNFNIVLLIIACIAIAIVITLNQHAAVLLVSFVADADNLYLLGSTLLT